MTITYTTTTRPQHCDRAWSPRHVAKWRERAVGLGADRLRRFRSIASGTATGLDIVVEWYPTFEAQAGVMDELSALRHPRDSGGASDQGCNEPAARVVDARLAYEVGFQPSGATEALAGSAWYVMQGVSPAGQAAGFTAFGEQIDAIARDLGGRGAAVSVGQAAGTDIGWSATVVAFDDLGALGCFLDKAGSHTGYTRVTDALSGPDSPGRLTSSLILVEDAE